MMEELDQLHITELVYIDPDECALIEPTSSNSVGIVVTGDRVLVKFFPRRIRDSEKGLVAKSQMTANDTNDQKIPRQDKTSFMPLVPHSATLGHHHHRRPGLSTY